MAGCLPKALDMLRLGRTGGPPANADEAWIQDDPGEDGVCQSNGEEPEILSGCCLAEACFCRGVLVAWTRSME